MVKRNSWIVFTAVLVAFLGFIAMTRVRTAEREREQLLRTMANAKVLESYIHSRVRDGKYPTAIEQPLIIEGHTIEFTQLAGYQDACLGTCLSVWLCPQGSHYKIEARGRADPKPLLVLEPATEEDSDEPPPVGEKI